MIIHHIVLGISIIAWFITILRQRKSSIHLYFLITGLADPLHLMSIYFLGIPNGVIYATASICSYLAIRFTDIKSIKLLKSDYLLFIIYFSAVVTFSYLDYLVLGIHLLIFIKIIQRMIINLHFQGELNIFFLVLAFYELSLLIKGIVYLSGTFSGFIFFFITLAFQIIIAVFFIIFREDNPKLTFRLSSAVDSPS